MNSISFLPETSAENANNVRLLLGHSDIVYRRLLSELLARDGFCDIKEISTLYSLKESVEHGNFGLVILHSELLRDTAFDIDCENCLYIYDGGEIYVHNCLKLGKPLLKIKITEDIAHISEEILNILQEKEGDISENSQIKSLLNRLSFDERLKGYRYISSALEILLDCPKKADVLTKEVYPKLASRYKTTAGAVERNIRNALKKAWEAPEFNSLKNSFFDTGKRPSNGEMLKFLLKQLELTEL